MVGYARRQLHLYNYRSGDVMQAAHPLYELQGGVGGVSALSVAASACAQAAHLKVTCRGLLHQ